MARQKEKDNAVGAPPAKDRLWTSNFVLACFITLASFASFYFLLTTLPVYIVRIGGSESQVGLIIGVFSITALILRPVVGRAADDYGRRVFILAGNVILALASGLYALASTVPLLLGLRVLHGVGWAAFGTAASALVADVAPRSRRGEAMGYYGMFTNLAMAVGPAAGVILMQAYSFPVLFLASAGVALIAVVLALVVREPARTGSPRVGEGPAAGVIEPSSLFPALILLLTATTYGSIVSFLPLFASERGLGNPGLFFTVYALVLLVARGFTGQLSDRYGRVAVIAPGLVLAALALWLLAMASALPAFVVAAVLYGLAFAAVQPALMALVVDRAAPQRRGAALGTFTSAMDLGIGLGSIVWGVLAQLAGYGVVYAAAGAVALAALFVFLAGARGGALAVSPLRPAPPPDPEQKGHGAGR